MELLKIVCKIVESPGCVYLIYLPNPAVDQGQKAGQCSPADCMLMEERVMQCCCQYWVDDSTEISQLFTIPLWNLLKDFAKVIAIGVRRNASPELIKFHDFPVAS